MTGGKWTPAIAKRFFAERRKLFGPIRLLAAVESIEWLASRMVQDPRWKRIPWVAYGMATTHWETDATYEPIKEYADGWDYDISKNPRKAKKLGNTAKGDGPKFKGRGFSMITGKGNYERFSPVAGFDLVTYLEDAMQPLVAYEILTVGMTGKPNFTGVNLENVTDSAGMVDYDDARRIINGTDCAEKISGIAEDYEAVLTAALR